MMHMIQLNAASFALGRYEAFVVSAGTFALDGGAMFGIVPKPLWEKKIPADDKNRIDLATNCLLLKDGKRVILVDCGMGTKWPEKQAEQFKVHTTLADALVAAGSGVDDVTDLVLTHLHFDHAGGATRLGAGGALEMTFKNARVHVGRRNWAWAHNPNDRDRGSYRDESFSPLDGAERDRLVLIDDHNGRARLFDDFEAVFCEGHTTGQLLPLVGAGDQRALYAADMIPTRAHVKVAWNMGYDLRPLELLDEKRRLLTLCADEGVTLMHEHEMRGALSAVSRDGHDFAAAPTTLHTAGVAHG
jgi:glyoxylase-like metal-dependent hydrolase (beta-lactamase superfamily II)